MKKGSFVFLAAVLLLAGCSAKKADGDILQSGKDAISITDSFLDGKMNAKTASEKIDILSESIKIIDFSDIRSPDGEIYTKIAELSFKLESVPESGEDEGNSVLDARNSLAESVGVSQRSSKDVGAYQPVYPSEEESETST